MSLLSSLKEVKDETIHSKVERFIKEKTIVDESKIRNDVLSGYILDKFDDFYQKNRRGFLVAFVKPIKAYSETRYFDLTKDSLDSAKSVLIIASDFASLVSSLARTCTGDSCLLELKQQEKAIKTIKECDAALAKIDAALDAHPDPIDPASRRRIAQRTSFLQNMRNINYFRLSGVSIKELVQQAGETN